jgi:hypothetical protein
MERLGQSVVAHEKHTVQFSDEVSNSDCQCGNQITSWSRVLEKLAVAHLVEKFLVL